MSTRLGIRLYRSPEASWTGLSADMCADPALSFAGESFSSNHIESEDGNAVLVDTGSMLQLRSTVDVWTIWFQPRDVPVSGPLYVSYLTSTWEDPFVEVADFLIDCGGTVQTVVSVPGLLMEGVSSTIQFYGDEGMEVTLPTCGPTVVPDFWTNFNLTYEIP